MALQTVTIELKLPYPNKVIIRLIRKMLVSLLYP